MPELNDPRVYFAAERTLLAWNRTSISLMAFGFVIERFGLFLHMAEKQELVLPQRSLSFLVGVVFILLGAMLAAYSTVQFRRVLKALKPNDIPAGYNVRAATIGNLLVALLGLLLVVYLVRGML